MMVWGKGQHHRTKIVIATILAYSFSNGNARGILFSPASMIGLTALNMNKAMIKTDGYFQLIIKISQSGLTNKILSTNFPVFNK